MAGRMSRRRWVILVVAVVAAMLVLMMPPWAGYFSPKAAAYITLWRPWRTHLSLRHERTFPGWPQRSTVEAEYKDPWPGQTRTPGWQVDFLTVKRLRSWLPWVVTEHATGP